ncbi:hypothetical protein [Flavobacterium cerinum]|uniref:Lipoprotein n=1 Tax=Flavobacterium cerinum TaxID=2502784 RepID=A0ABY5IXS4_9FLAO|nr:hypothetical protein [Flavobacterium cerinum]UUC46281.1 hypothetical protein NOX80_03535 [Flavobacterium cerinum]
MKKILVMFVVVSSIIACGGDKSKKAAKEAAIKETVNKYAMEMDAVYEKDDSLVVFYQKDNHYQYDRPISLKIKGSPVMQRLILNLPEGEPVENIKISVSNSKDQQFLTVKNITIKNGDKVVVDGDNGKHTDFFVTDEGFSWDPEKSRYILHHDKKYPPNFVGNDNLLVQLSK